MLIGITRTMRWRSCISYNKNQNVSRTAV